MSLPGLDVKSTEGLFEVTLDDKPEEGLGG
jgi:hypothetical protein